jgi:hypothetical protein
MSSLTLGLLIILVVATGVFYVAGIQVQHGVPWASDLSSTSVVFVIILNGLQ